ncbi:MAG: LLM class flavin-dependent oxidoreductase [Chloroflexota bacterium]
MIRLSVLDQSPIRSGGSAADAIRETLDLAVLAERLGYHRYWLAEHHSTPSLAGSSPEILIGQVAARTSKIRVGSGGVMLSHYSPFKVAENFRVLETLFPGRIDLGIGRAPGSDQLTARALQPGSTPRSIEQFPYQVADLIDFVRDTVPSEHEFSAIRAMPAGPTAPDVWLLGSTAESASYAAHFGTAFSFAHFINDRGGDKVVRAYAEAFRPSAALPKPVANVAVHVICADTEEWAVRLGKCRSLATARLYTGQRAPFPSVEEAESHQYTQQELAIIEHTRGRTIVGTPDRVRTGVTELAERYGVDEVIAVTICHRWEDRVRSYELLASAMGLPATPGD